jgi:hypothetical protein
MGVSGLQARAAAIEALSDGVVDRECDLHLLGALAGPQLISHPLAWQDCRSTNDFVVCGNPTGHYILNLAWPSERIIAEDLMIISWWTAEVAKSSRMPDVSQKGNYQFFRNEFLDTKTFTYRPDWLLPTSGILEFDVVVPRRLPKTMKVLDESAFGQVKTALLCDASPGFVRALALRRVSPKVCLSSQQALALFRILTVEDGCEGGGKRGVCMPSLEEITVLSILIFRIKDYHNIRQVFFKNPGPFGSLERLRCCEHHLGCLNLADPLHLSTEVRLDTSVHEERQYVKMILNIAFQEGNRTLDPKSFRDCAYGAGYPDLQSFSSGAPPDRWVKTGLPQRGVLVMTYIYEEQNNLRFRRRQAQLVCGWET